VVDTTIGILLVLLFVLFVVIAVYYFRRQARALEYVAEIEEARFMRQKQLWREEDAQQVRIDKPYSWLSTVASRALEKNIMVLSVERALPGIPALETVANDGRKVVFSTLEPRKLRGKVGKPKSHSKGTVARLERFAAETPLLGQNPRKAKAGEMSLIEDEWFDVKAGKIGKGFQVYWGEPERLWVYLVEQKT
jgi:hypothetical protein